jgi:2-octaprenyl-6-methoxyphenol hydroxylase
LGNAAHTVHPVAGQGLNLSLRDIEELVSCIDQGLEKDLRINEFSILQKYVTKRDYDQNQVINFTHSLVETFSSSSFFKAFPRKLGLLTLDLFPALRQELVMRASGKK